jgi:hypothetical protein
VGNLLRRISSKEEYEVINIIASWENGSKVESFRERVDHRILQM